MDIDLNIDNYNFDEMCRIFKIKDTIDMTENENKIDKTLKIIRETFPQNIGIQMFYQKVSKIVKSIYKLFDENQLLDLDEESKVTSYIGKIKDIDNFELMDPHDIVDIFHKKYLDAAKKKADEENKVDESSYITNTKAIVSLNNKNKTNPIVDSFQNLVAPGSLNSLKRIIQSQSLCINSCFRENYYKTISTDFIFIIPAEIKNVLSLRLSSIEIPNAWYLISAQDNNNSFTISVSDDNVYYDTYTITVPDGNYSAACLSQYLNSTYFYLAKPPLSPLLSQINYSVNKYDFKSSFTNIGTNPLYMSLYFYDNMAAQSCPPNYGAGPMTTLGWIMGFRKADYLQIYNELVSEGLFDGGGDRYIYVALDDYQKNRNIQNIVPLEKSLLNEDIIAKIPMSNGKLSLIIDNSNALTKLRTYNGPINLNRFRVKILDKYGNIINLNYMDFSFTLELELLYESFNFNNVFA